jgi:hypothetical protein
VEDGRAAVRLLNEIDNFVPEKGKCEKKLVSCFHFSTLYITKILKRIGLLKGVDDLVNTRTDIHTHSHKHTHIHTHIHTPLVDLEGEEPLSERFNFCSLDVHKKVFQTHLVHMMRRLNPIRLLVCLMLRQRLFYIS